MGDCRGCKGNKELYTPLFLNRAENKSTASSDYGPALVGAAWRSLQEGNPKGVGPVSNYIDRINQSQFAGFSKRNYYQNNKNCLSRGLI